MDERNLTDTLNSLNNSEDVLDTKAAWSYPVTQDVEFVVPKYFVGVKADRMGSYDPISSIKEKVSHP